MTATAASSLEDHLREKLAGPSPLPLKDLSAGLPALKGKAKAAREVELARLLHEAEQAGRAFRRPTGAGGADRFWHRDERDAIAETLVAAATAPRSEAELKKVAAEVAAKPFAGFVQTVIGELVAAGRLYRAPGKAAKYVDLPPRQISPLEKPAVAKKVQAFAANFDKLLGDTGVSADELFAAVRRLMKSAPAAHPHHPTATPHEPAARSAKTAPHGPETPPHPHGAVDLAELIFKYVTNASSSSVLSLADVRAAMPAGYQDRQFDRAVFKLAEDEKVVIYSDGDAAALSPAARAQLVEDEHGNVFRTITRATL